MQTKPIYVTERDYERIEALLDEVDTGAAPDLDALRQELQRAKIVDSDSVADDVVTMHSTVSFENTETGKRFDLALVYPGEMDDSPARVSILAPVGSALLGLSVGQSIDWPMSGGKTITLRVLAVNNQPESRAGKAD